MDAQKQIEKLQKRVEFLEKELFTDELTRILNRRGLMAGLQPLVNAALFQINNPQRRKNVIIQAFSAIFVDIDHFKKINDTFGHPAGDIALKAVAQILRSGVREIDLVGRYGGEEMVVGLVGANLTDALRIAENLRAKIEATEILFEKATIRVTASFGVSTLRANMNTESLLHAADQALYRAKRTGRNKVVAAK